MALGRVRRGRGGPGMGFIFALDLGGGGGRKVVLLVVARNLGPTL